MIWSLDGECGCIKLSQDGRLAQVEKSGWWPTYGDCIVRIRANKRLGGDRKMLLKSVTVLKIVVQESYCGLRKGPNRFMGFFEC